MPVKTAVAPSLSRVLGKVPILPGESAEQYQQSLDALIEELGATSVLQVYLAEKIHECLWWIHRYEEQKRTTIIVHMALLASGSSTSRVTETKEHVRSMILAATVDKQTTAALRAIGHTLESLQQKVMVEKQESLLQLDQQIALQSKILTGFQRSYEVAFNRKMYAERLELQNIMMRQDLKGIEVPDDAASSHE